MTAAERIQRAIDISRTRDCTVCVTPEGPTHAEALYEELLTVCDDSCEDTFWGDGWQIRLIGAASDD